MKKMLLLTLVSILLLLTGCALGLNQAPKAVRQAFDSQFPGASHVEWERVLSTYKAEFYHDGHEKEAQFDKDGTWKRTKTELTFLDIPAPVMKAAQEYCDWEIDDISCSNRRTASPPTTRSNTTGSIRTARSSSSCSRTGPFSPESDP